MEDLFVIIEDRDGKYWSNDLGWIDYISSADVFTKEETVIYNLPIGGEWINLSNLFDI